MIGTIDTAETRNGHLVNDEGDINVAAERLMELLEVGGRGELSMTLLEAQEVVRILRAHGAHSGRQILDA